MMPKSEPTKYFEALFALYGTLRHDSEFYQNSVQRLLGYFETPKALQVRGSTFHDGLPITVSLTACSEEMKEEWFKEDHLVHVGGTILKIEGAAQFPGTEKVFFTDQDGKKTAHTEEELRSFWEKEFPAFLDLTIQTYICALMIALPGTVRATSNVWTIDGTRHSFSSRYLSQIHESVEFLIENSVTPSSTPSPDDAVRWVFSQNGVFDGYSDTPASRCLNFFTRLFVRDYRNDELSDLIWALAGIESVLVEGGRSSVGQLREKLTALFPSERSNWITKMIGDVYEYRSRMIHGNRQIRSEFRSDESDTDSRFREEYDSVLFASGTLVLVLQYLIENKRTSLKFKTVIA